MLELIFELVLSLAVIIYVVVILYMILIIFFEWIIFSNAKCKVWRVIDVILERYIQNNNYDDFIFDMKNVLNGTTMWSLKADAYSWTQSIPRVLNKYLYDLNTKKRRKYNDETIENKVSIVHSLIKRYEYENQHEELLKTQNTKIKRLVNAIIKEDKEELFKNAEELKEWMDKNGQEQNRKKKTEMVNRVVSIVGIIVTVVSILTTIF